MNSYAKKLMAYHLVHQLHHQGFSISYISKHCELDWRSVKKYLSMSEAQYEAFLHTQCERKKQLEPYESFIHSRLSSYPDTSAAQMHDWLKEHHADFPQVNPKTVFNFVNWVRQKYHLLKTEVGRQYQMVEETPYGAQAQADFGEYKLRTTQGHTVKVYFFAFCLSRSRYKFVCFSTSKFNAHRAIEAHQQAFAYMQGVPDSVVYDQDRVFLVEENKGDLILTEKFRAYTKEAGFKLHFCRKADPQSKGKVENVVKYVKQNFLYNRCFSDMESLNEEALQWLARTANHMPHSSTRQQPHAEWLIEKAYLQPYHAIELKREERLVYTVRKDNSISFKGNFYSLPLGTYKGKGSKVQLEIQEAKLFIYDEQGALLCSHAECISKGQKIINTDHKREKSAALRELIHQVCSSLEDPELGKSFLEAVRTDKPRYLRDQVLVLKQCIETYSREIISEALHYCCNHRLRSALDLKSIAEYLASKQSSWQGAKVVQMNPFSGTVPTAAYIQPASSCIADYSALF
jgi:IS30 family transposase